MSIRTIVGSHMTAVFGSTLPPSPTASGLLLNPPSIILLSRGKLEPTDVNTALAYFTNQRIASLLLIQPPSHMSCRPTKLQAVADLFVANGTSSMLRDAPFLIADMSTYVITVLITQRHGITITKQCSVLILQLDSQYPSRSLDLFFLSAISRT